MPPVLVHGPDANSFTWAPLQREPALRGLRPLAVALRDLSSGEADALTPHHSFDVRPLEAARVEPLAEKPAGL